MKLFFSLMILVNTYAAELSMFAYDVNLKESIVDVKGIRYRKIEYKGDVFLLRLLGTEVRPETLQMICGQESHLDMENQIFISTKITKRSSLFIEGLKQTCQDIGAGRRVVSVDPNIQIGFIFDDSKSAILKNKRVYVNPLNKQIGVGADW